MASDIDGPRAITDSERSDCMTMLDRVFNTTPDGYFHRYFEGDPWFKNDCCRVLLVDGRIASSVSICRREVRVGCVRLAMGGIANVGTDPEYRKRGYSSEVLRDAVRTMDAEEMDFSFLYTGRYDFYSRVGWRRIAIPALKGMLKTAEPARADAGYTVRPYDPGTDASALLRIYDEFNAERTLTAVRTERYWRSFSMHRFRDNWRITFAEDKSGPVAYTIGSVRDKVLWFHEMGFAGGHAAALATLFRDAAADAAAGGAGEVMIELAADPAVVEAASEIAADLDVSHLEHTMVMFLNLPRTFHRLLPELNRRARSATLSGSVGVETEIGSVGLEADGTRIRIVDASNARHGAKLTQPDLARLVFGIGPVEDAGSDVSEGACEFLSALFPAQPSVYWLADKF